MVRDPDRISGNAHKITFCKLLRARLNEPPPLHRLLSRRVVVGLAHWVDGCLARNWLHFRRMVPRINYPDPTWVEQWLDAVRRGATSMSQRKLKRLEDFPGGVSAVRRLAKKKGVHLLLLTDDKGVELVAASSSPFKIIC